MSCRLLRSSRRGASPAPIIVCVVIVLAGAIVSYFMYRNGEERLAELNKKKEELASVQGKLAGAREALAEWDETIGVPVHTAETLMKEAEQPTYLAYQKYIQDTSEDAQRKFDEARTRLDRTRQAADAAIENLSRKNEEKKKQIEATLRKIYTTLDNVESTKATLARTLAKEKDNARQAKERLQEYETQFQDAKGRLAKEEEALREKLDVVEKALHPPPSKVIQADGHIIHADTATGIVSIDLGIADRARPGMVFKVFRQDEAGALIEKGKIRVTDVNHPNMSLCGTIEITDAAYPFVHGDMVEAPNFPEVKKFILIGEFDPDKGYDRQEILGMIKRYGGEVVDLVDVDTDFIVAGDLSEDRPEWKKMIADARDYRVPILRLKEFVRYVGKYVH